MAKKRKRKKRTPSEIERFDIVNDVFLDSFAAMGVPLMLGIGPYVKGSSSGDYTGFILRLYQPYARKRDGVLILRKICDVRVFCVLVERWMRSDDPRIWKVAEASARELAEKYGWAYEAGARHNKPVNDTYQLYIEMSGGIAK